jgi:hypothetical protein
MERLKQLEIKKLMKELEFTEIDFNYKYEVINEVDNKFIKDVNDFLLKHPDLKKIYEEKTNLIVEEESNKPTDVTIFEGDIIVDDEKEIIVDDDIENVPSESKSPKLKKLYRDIVKETHPDKVKNEKLNGMYITATNYYNTDDLAGIYVICDDLNIKYDIDIEDSDLINDKIRTLRDRIRFMEATFTWKWYYSKSEKDKEMIVLNFIKKQIQ